MAERHLPSLSKRQPNVVTVTNTEQMLSRRSANQREVITNKNHASERTIRMNRIFLCQLKIFNIKTVLTVKENLSVCPDGRQTFSLTFPRL